MKKIAQYILILIATIPLSCSKEGKGLLNTSGKGGSLARFTIVGHYLYTVDKTRLKVFNIADAGAPTLSATEDVGFEIETIFPFKDKLFIGSTSVVHIFSIEDPEHPKKLSTAISPTVMRRCDPVVAKDSVAYATLRTNGPCGGIESILAVYDIRNITAPVQVNSYGVFEPYGLGYADNALYVCDKYGLLVFNIADAFNPVLVTRLMENENEFYDVIPEDNTLVCWVKQGVVLFDISTRLEPKLITKIQ